MTTLKERVGNLQGSLQPTDPDLAGAFETEFEPMAVAPTGGGPQRLTFTVPFQSTVWSMSQELVGDGEGFNGIDQGLGAHTENHVDFQAVTAPATTVTIGQPKSRTPTFQRDAVPCKVVGYGMATEGMAYHEAEQQHYVLSKSGDVIVRAASAKPAVLTAFSGTTEINAGVDVSITGKREVRMSGGTWTPAKPERNQAWVTSGFASTGGILAQTAGVIAGVIAGMQGVVGTLSPVVKTGNAKAPGSATTPQPSGKLIGCAAGAAGGCVLAHIGMGAYGSCNATVSAGLNAGMFANATMSVIGGLVGGLFGATADLKAFGVAGINAGSEASLASLGKAAVKGDKKVVATAKTDLNIASHYTVNIQGKDTHMSSDNNAALFSEIRNAKVLSAAFGLECTGGGVTVGSFSSTDSLGGASFENSKPYATVMGSKIVLSGPDKKAKVTLDDSGAELKFGDHSMKIKKNKNFATKVSGKLVMFKGC